MNDTEATWAAAGAGPRCRYAIPSRRGRVRISNALHVESPLLPLPRAGHHTIRATIGASTVALHGGDFKLKTLHSVPHIVPFRLCEDRKSTRLNSSHANISYAVFCLKKK